jgi:hypothetical protein
MNLEPIFDVNMKHLISFQTAKDLKPDVLMSYVKPENAIPLSELTLKDLSIYPGIGLYFFYDLDNRLQYVGKCTSRSFLERIPSHFDCRKHAQFATLVKKLGAENFKSNDVSVISHKALSELKLFLVNFTYDGIIRGEGKYSEEDVKPKTAIEAIYVGFLERGIIDATVPVLNRKVRR